MRDRPEPMYPGQMPGAGYMNHMGQLAAARPYGPGVTSFTDGAEIVPLWMPSGDPLQAAFLKAAMAPGDTDVAANGPKGDMTENTGGTEVTLQNTHPGHFRCASGAKVWYVVGVSGKNYIVAAKELALKCHATASGTISGSSGTVTGATSMDDGDAPSGSVSVSNPWNYYVASSGTCEISRNGSSWDITNVVRVSETFDTENSVSGTNLQHRYREIRVNPTGAEHAAETWHEGDACA